MKTHWTERSIEDYVFRIGADLIAQLEDKMEALNVSQNDLAEKLKITKGRVSQVFNHPGNITLGNIIRYVRALGMKASIVAYEDGDPDNKRGPINSDIFRICWEKCGKPRDFWAIQQHTLRDIKDHPVYFNSTLTRYIGKSESNIQPNPVTEIITAGTWNMGETVWTTGKTVVNVICDDSKGTQELHTMDYNNLMLPLPILPMLRSADEIRN